MIALDTNILVYAHHSRYAEHRRAQSAILEAAGNRGGFGLPFPCLAEFWTVVTHPASSGRPSRPREARAFLASLIGAGAKVLHPSSGAAERILKLAVDLDIRGGRIFDLQIAETCLTAGAREVWTHDRNFPAIPGLKIHDPL